MTRILLLACCAAVVACGEKAGGRDEDTYLAALERVDELERENRDLRDAISEANQRIQDAQAQVDNVRLVAGSCEDLRWAADDLEDVDEVDEP